MPRPQWASSACVLLAFHAFLDVFRQPLAAASRDLRPFPEDLDAAHHEHGTLSEHEGSPEHMHFVSPEHEYGPEHGHLEHWAELSEPEHSVEHLAGHDHFIGDDPFLEFEHFPEADDWMNHEHAEHMPPDHFEEHMPPDHYLEHEHHPEHFPEHSDHHPDHHPEHFPEHFPEHYPDHHPEHFPDHHPEHYPEHHPEHMPPEHMPPEHLPAEHLPPEDKDTAAATSAAHAHDPKECRAALIPETSDWRASALSCGDPGAVPCGDIHIAESLCGESPTPLILAAPKGNESPPLFNCTSKTIVDSFPLSIEAHIDLLHSQNKISILCRKPKLSEGCVVQSSFLWSGCSQLCGPGGVETRSKKKVNCAAGASSSSAGPPVIEEETRPCVGRREGLCNTIGSGVDVHSSADPFGNVEIDPATHCFALEAHKSDKPPEESSCSCFYSSVPCSIADAMGTLDKWTNHLRVVCSAEGPHAKVLLPGGYLYNCLGEVRDIFAATRGAGDPDSKQAALRQVCSTPLVYSLCRGVGDETPQKAAEFGLAPMAAMIEDVFKEFEDSRLDSILQENDWHIPGGWLRLGSVAVVTLGLVGVCCVSCVRCCCWDSCPFPLSVFSSPPNASKDLSPRIKRPEKAWEASDAQQTERGAAAAKTMKKSEGSEAASLLLTKSN